jgi:hypothetical protein
MIMTAVAKAVYRGSDGSVHYLSSSPDHSLLIITDPVLGVERIEFDGPAQLTSHPKSDGVGYVSVSASTTTTTVAVGPGQPPLIHQYGFCFPCAFPPLGQAVEGHDFELWPQCPSGDPHRKRRADADSDNIVPLPEPSREPGSPSSTGTGAEPTEPSRGKPRVRVLDAEPESEPVQEESLSRREAASRWGPTPGAYW